MTNSICHTSIGNIEFSFLSQDMLGLEINRRTQLYKKYTVSLILFYFLRNWMEGSSRTRSKNCSPEDQPWHPIGVCQWKPRHRQLSNPGDYTDLLQQLGRWLLLLLGWWGFLSCLKYTVVLWCIKMPRTEGKSRQVACRTAGLSQTAPVPACHRFSAHPFIPPESWRR